VQALQRGEAVSLVLCGERSAAFFGPERLSIWQRLRPTAAPHAVLETL
jgi:hypothetical protein